MTHARWARLHVGKGILSRRPRGRRKSFSNRIALDDPRRSHGPRLARGTDLNGPTGAKGNNGRPPRFERAGKYGSKPKTHKKAGWA